MTLSKDSAPLYIILKGAIGRYAVEVPEEATEDWDLARHARQSPI